MTQRAIITLIAMFAAVEQGVAQEPYGFITRLGADTLAVEWVTPTPGGFRADLVERNPRVVRSQYAVELDRDGALHRFDLVRTAANPSGSGAVRTLVEFVNGRAGRGSAYRIRLYRRDSLLFTADTVIYTPLLAMIYGAAMEAALKQLSRQGGDTLAFATIASGSPRLGAIVLRHAGANRYTVPLGYLFKYHATLGADERLMSISGRETTLKFELERLDPPRAPALDAVFAAWSALEAQNGIARELSARDTLTVRAPGFNVSINYGRPLARGRTILGGVVPYDSVWRTGANAATHLTLSAPALLAGRQLDAGTYTLWTIPGRSGATLIVSSLTQVWGTAYDAARDVIRVPMAAAAPGTRPDRMEITLATADSTRFTLGVHWGNIAWTVALESCAPHANKPAACK